MAILDALVPAAVETVADTPPDAPVEGRCYLVGSGAAGEWADRADQIALRIGGSWHFIEPTAGMEIYDRSSQRKLLYLSGWNGATAPATPAGGTTVDIEARAALSELIAMLGAAGILASPG